MSKTLQTVYVPNKKTHQEFLMYLKSKGELEETQSYLYTEQEHQAAQVYMEALGDVLELWEQGTPLDSSTVNKCRKALSSAPTTQTNVLDDLEKWVKEFPYVMNQKDLLAKIQSLKLQPTTQNGWISVEDELPLTNKNVLVFSTDKGIGEATKGRRNIDGRYFTVCGMQLFEVTHWQPLPLKPQP